MALSDIIEELGSRKQPLISQSDSNQELILALKYNKENVHPVLSLHHNVLTYTSRYQQRVSIVEKAHRKSNKNKSPSNKTNTLS